MKKSKPEKEPKTYAAPALDKGLDIIELLATSSETLSLSQIASQLDRKVTEIFRMLAVLVRRGYVAVDDQSDKYYLTMKMFQVTHSMPAVKRLTALGAPILKRLAHEVLQSCHLAIANDMEALVVAQQDSPANRSFGVRIGATAPILNTCSGNLLYAYADELTQEAIFRNYSENDESLNRSELEKVEQTIKSRGYHQVASSQVMGVTDIGCPVFDHTGTTIAALIVPYLKRIDGQQRYTIPDTRKIAKRYADELSTALGFVD